MDYTSAQIRQAADIINAFGESPFAADHLREIADAMDGVFND